MTTLASTPNPFYPSSDQPLAAGIVEGPKLDPARLAAMTTAINEAAKLSDVQAHLAELAYNRILNAVGEALLAVAAEYGASGLSFRTGDRRDDPITLVVQDCEAHITDYPLADAVSSDPRVAEIMSVLDYDSGRGRELSYHVGEQPVRAARVEPRVNRHSYSIGKLLPLPTE